MEYFGCFISHLVELIGAAFHLKRWKIKQRESTEGRFACLAFKHPGGSVSLYHLLKVTSPSVSEQTEGHALQL